MGRVKALAAEDLREFTVDSGTIKVMSRLADNDQLARLFALDPDVTRRDISPLTDGEVEVVARGPIAKASRKGRTLRALTIVPGTAKAPPRDPRISLLQVGPLSFSLPGTPDGLAFQMDERGNGQIHALSDDRMRLGSNGMWWIVTQLIEALEDPQTVSCWPRFLTVAGVLGGPAAKASLQYSDTGICLAWRRLQSGMVGDVLAWQELSHERAQGWLSMLRPVLAELEQREVHRQQLLPARTAERWAHAVERWTA